MTTVVPEKPVSASPLPALSEPAAVVPAPPLAAMVPENKDGVRFSRARQIVARFAGATLVGAFVEGYTVSGSTTRGLVHAGMELGTKVATTTANILGPRA